MINLGRLKINFAEAGKGAPLVMIHGWTNDWRGMIPLGRYLAKNMRVILVDLPGYGQSGRLPRYSLEIEANAIKTLKEKLELDKFYLLGHSMGSFVAAKYYQKYPNDLLGLIMVGAVFKKKARRRLITAGHWIYGWAENHKSAQKVIGFLIKKRAYAYLAAYLMNMYKFDKELVDKYGVISRKNIDIKAYIEIGEELLGTNTEKMLATQKAPVLFLYGKHDKICNATQAKAVIGDKRWQYAEIEEAGHVVTVEQPQKAAAAIWKFVSSGLESNQP